MDHRGCKSGNRQRRSQIYGGADRQGHFGMETMRMNPPQGFADSSWLKYRGPCALCGSPDARHRLFDAWRGMNKGGDSVESLAQQWNAPVEVVRFIVEMSHQAYGGWMRRTRPRPWAPTHTWRLRRFLPEFFGLHCRVLCRGNGLGPRNILVEFKTGYKVVTSRFAVRRIRNADPT